MTEVVAVGARYVLYCKQMSKQTDLYSHTLLDILLQVCTQEQPKMLTRLLTLFLPAFGPSHRHCA